MKIIYFATSNKVKIIYAQKALSGIGVKVKQIKMDFNESRSYIPPAIAMEKAKEAYNILKAPVIVEDSGFFIKALGGFPMTHIHFALETLGIKHIVKAMSEEKNRQAFWLSTLAYVDHSQTKLFNYKEFGSIAKTLRPKKRRMMSDLWHIYIPTKDNPKKLALSEMSPSYAKKYEDKMYNQLNHFKKFSHWLIKVIK